MTLAGRFALLFAGANRPTVIKPEHVRCAAESIRDETYAKETPGLDIRDLSSMEHAMIQIRDAQVGSRGHDTLIVDLLTLPARDCLRLLFLSVVFAYRWDADCHDGIPPVVFRVRCIPCRILRFLFRLVQVKEDLTLVTLHDFMQLLLTQGGKPPADTWLPDVLL